MGTTRTIYSIKDITSDYDKGYSIDGITERYKKSQEIDFGNKMSTKKARDKVCEVIYDFIIKRGCIVKRSDQNAR